MASLGKTVPKIVTLIKKDITRREHELSNSGRMTFDEADMPYTVNEITGRTIYTHFTLQHRTRDQKLATLEKFNGILLDWEKKGRSCSHAQMLKHDLRKDPLQLGRIFKLIEMEGKLLRDRERHYVKAKAEGQSREQLVITMRK